MTDTPAAEMTAVDPLVRIERALISVSDKTGMVYLGRILAERGVEILSTGGSARALADAGVPVKEVSAHTGFPEILDGRVKTLHPKIHGGLLARRDSVEHRDAMTDYAIAPIDLLVVNLYPFEATVAQGADFGTCIENIDIGGVALIRAAAKNHAFVTVVTDPADYEALIADMAAHDGASSAGLRRRLAAAAFARTAAYDAAISSWFAEQAGDLLPERLILAGRRTLALRYGENPHQQAAFYTSGSARPGVATARQVEIAAALGARLAGLGLQLLCGGKNGVMEAVCRGNLEAGGRPIGLVPDEVVEGGDAGHLRVRAGVAGGPTNNGFCGVLLGVGGGDLDHRGAALAQRGSGTGGGMLCTFGTDGRVRFREHTDEDRPLAFATLDAETTVAPDGPHPPARGEAVDLVLDVLPRGSGRFDVSLQALDPGSGRELAAGVRRGVPGSAVRGGLSLVSSPPPDEPGARWWFEDLRTAGRKIATRPDRALEPVLGTLFSLDDGTLKLTAQLLPVGALGTPDERRVRLEYRAGDDEEWRRGAASVIEEGYVARFRLEDWDASRAWQYRVVYEGERTWTYEGEVPREPTDPEALTVALFSCTKPTGRQLETERAAAPLPGSSPPGRYTPGNVYFPHETVVANTAAHDPDLLVFAGDQLYEENPTRVDERPDPHLDYLYKWYLWLWAFRDLTRDRPSVVLVDDHDVYQSNLWGDRGRAAPDGNIGRGGYRTTPAFVNRSQRIQCGHNPDPADDRPVERGIDVYYTAFEYGGVRFALLEDRKFKSAPGADDGRLLGDRQLSFLREWAREGGDEPHVCLTQTVFASAQTTPEGAPVRDYDSNGYPREGRDRAVEALEDGEVKRSTSIPTKSEISNGETPE